MKIQKPRLEVYAPLIGIVAMMLAPSFGMPEGRMVEFFEAVGLITGGTVLSRGIAKHGQNKSGE